MKSYFKCNLKQDRESTRDKVRLFQVLELQKRRHLHSTDSYTGREETRVLQMCQRRVPEIDLAGCYTEGLLAQRRWKQRKAVWQERKEPILVTWLWLVAAAAGCTDTKKSKGYQVIKCIEESCFCAEENQTISPSEPLRKRCFWLLATQSSMILPAMARGFRNQFSLK